jgi:hypothetical protein
MSRRIELVAAVLACALGLIWLVYEANTLQALWVLGAINGSGAGPAPEEPIGWNGTGLYFAGMAAIMICVALGAYLHVVQRRPRGLWLMWLAAALATLGIGLYQIEPWRLVPTQFIYLVQAESYSWLTAIGVLSVIFAWIAAVAALPIRAGLAPRANADGHARVQPGAEPLTMQQIDHGGTAG